MEPDSHSFFELSAHGLNAAARTHTGRVRRINEDTFVCDVERGLFAVIDGMGGANAGEVAAELTRETLIAGSGDLPTLFFNANQTVYERAARRPEERGMGCVATAARVDGTDLRLAHVGDTRALLANSTGCEQLTRDHTVVADIQEERGYTRAQAEEISGKNQVTRDIGGRRYDDTSWIDSIRTPFEVDDLLLLCSDGLSDLVGDGELFSLLSRARRDGRSMKSLVNTLIELALERGAHDNVTVVAVHREAILPIPEAERPPPLPAVAPAPIAEGTPEADGPWVASADTSDAVGDMPQAIAERWGESEADLPDEDSAAPHGTGPQGWAAVKKDRLDFRRWWQGLGNRAARPRNSLGRLAISLLLGAIAALGLVAGWLWLSPQTYQKVSHQGLLTASTKGASIVTKGPAGLSGTFANSSSIAAMGRLSVDGLVTETVLDENVRIAVHGADLRFPRGEDAKWRIRITDGGRLLWRLCSIQAPDLKVEILFDGQAGRVRFDSCFLHLGELSIKGTEPGDHLVEVLGGPLYLSTGPPKLENAELEGDVSTKAPKFPPSEPEAIADTVVDSNPDSGEQPSADADRAEGSTVEAPEAGTERNGENTAKESRQ